jgi:hypothetical protein
VLIKTSFFLLICLFLKLIFYFSMTDVKNKWENSSWGRKLIVQKRRASLTDFDRFKLMLAKIKVCNCSNICPCSMPYFMIMWI